MPGARFGSSHAVTEAGFAIGAANASATNAGMGTESGLASVVAMIGRTSSGRAAAAAVATRAGEGTPPRFSTGRIGGMRTTTIVPEFGGDEDDKSPATPTANESVLSANAAARTRTKAWPIMARQALTESRSGVTPSPPGWGDG